MPHRDTYHWPVASQFMRDEHGTVTIESVLWIPVFAIVLVVAIDATVLYLHQTEMVNVARDVARRIARGDVTEADAAATVQNELSLYGSGYVVATSAPGSAIVNVAIQTSVADASVFGIIARIAGDSLNQNLFAVISMRRELGATGTPPPPPPPP